MKARVFLLIFFAAWSFAAASCANNQSAPSPTPPPTKFARPFGTSRSIKTNPSPPSTETATPVPSRAPSSDSPAPFVDNFSAPCLLTEEDTETRATKCENGSYSIRLKSADEAHWVWYPGKTWDNAVIEVDANVVSGTAFVGYGLAFHISQLGDSATIFDLTRNGRFSLYNYSRPIYTLLVGSTASSAIQLDNTANHLKVILQGNQLALYVNHQWLDTISNKSFSPGRVGLFVETRDPDAKVAFSNLKITPLEKPLALPVAQPTFLPTQIVQRFTPPSLPTIPVLPTVPVVQPIFTPATPVPTSTPEYPLPPGKGGLVVHNYYGSEAVFTIANHQYKLAGSGGEQFLALDPGIYPWTFFIASQVRTNGSTIIESGKLTLKQFPEQ